MPQPRPPRRYTITLEPDLAEWIEGTCRFGPGPHVPPEEGIAMLLKLAMGFVQALAADYAKEKQRQWQRLN